MLKKIIVLVGGAVLLSGCTITVPGTTPIVDTGAPNAFNQKVQAGSMWKSTDGGQTFSVKSRVDEKQSITKADVLALSFHPTDHATLYFGTVDNGIFKTVDSGETWQQIVFPPKKIYSFILDKNDPDKRMFASGMLNNVGKIFRTDDGGENWRAVYTEPVAEVVITLLAQHPRDINVLFAGTSAGTVVKSTDGGETWKNVGNSLSGPITEIVFDATKPLSLYALSFNSKVYYSDDGGVVWTEPKSDRTDQGSSEAVTPGPLLALVADPSISGRVYGSKSGGLYRSNNFAKDWEKINIIESAEKSPVRAIAINPHDSNEIVFVAGKAFYKSKNGGETWSVVDLYIDRSASVLMYDPNNPLALYLALRKTN